MSDVEETAAAEKDEDILYNENRVRELEECIESCESEIRDHKREIDRLKDKDIKPNKDE
jgi:hypothetical protein